LVLLVCFCILFPCSLSIILGCLLLQCVTLFYVYLLFFSSSKLGCISIWELHNVFLLLLFPDCLLISHHMSLHSIEIAIGFFWLPSLLFFKVDVIFFMLLFTVQVLEKHCMISSFILMLVGRKRYRCCEIGYVWQHVSLCIYIVRIVFKTGFYD
jgi:hypothetical protein